MIFRLWCSVCVSAGTMPSERERARARAHVRERERGRARERTFSCTVDDRCCYCYSLVMGCTLFLWWLIGLPLFSLVMCCTGQTLPLLRRLSSDRVRAPAIRRFVSIALVCALYAAAVVLWMTIPYNLCRLDGNHQRDTASAHSVDSVDFVK